MPDSYRLTKQQLCNAIATTLGIPGDPLGPGSKEHLGFLQSIVRTLGLGEGGGKHELTRRILQSLGQPWDEGCISAGDTVTALALERILEGLGKIPTRMEAVHDAVVGQLLASPAATKPPVGNLRPIRLRIGPEVFVRSPEVAAYILRRAHGRCEGCGAQAPFMRTDGTPYLEVHHVVPLAQGGPDTVDNTVALCPTCHRRAHYAIDSVAFNGELMERRCDAHQAGSAPPCPPDQGK